MRPSEIAWSKFDLLGKHIRSIEINYSDGAALQVRVSSTTQPNRKRRAADEMTVELKGMDGTTLWSGVHMRTTAEDDIEEVEVGDASDPASQAEAQPECVNIYSALHVDVISTRRLDVRVRPREETVRKYDGVAFEKRVGLSTDRVRSFLEAISGERQHPPSFPRVLVLAAHVGLAAERFAEAYLREAAARDTRTTTTTLKGQAFGSDRDSLTANVIALEAQLQSTLAQIGLGDLPRFIDISLQRALGAQPDALCWYFQHSLESLRRLETQLRPLAVLLNEANRVLRGCALHIHSKDELDRSKVKLPIGQQRLLAVRFDGSDEIHELATLSSGQQHMLVLLARIWMGDLNPDAAPRSQGRLLLIDEPEISLHLAWQHEIAQQLRRFAESTDSQVLVATHSNFISGSLPAQMVIEI
jgi:hypothetical protein